MIIIAMPELPKTCHRCPISYIDGLDGHYYCSCLQDEANEHGRLEECPLYDVSLEIKDDELDIERGGHKLRILIEETLDTLIEYGNTGEEAFFESKIELQTMWFEFRDNKKEKEDQDELP